MTADNWSECPECEKRHADEECRMIKHLREDYGKISLEDYEKRQSDLKEFLRREFDLNLREDYQFILDPATETLGVYYRCHCSVCSFGFMVNEDIDYAALT